MVIKIDETHRMGQVPIVVGGTSYWIQHLLFPGRLSSPSNARGSIQATISKNHMTPDLKNSVDSLPPELLILLDDLPLNAPSANENPEMASAMHRLLSLLDAPMANRWHWRDTRKVLRTLQILRESGRRPSKIIEEQSSQSEELRPR